MSSSDSTPVVSDSASPVAKKKSLKKKKKGEDEVTGDLSQVTEEVPDEVPELHVNGENNLSDSSSAVSATIPSEPSALGSPLRTDSEEVPYEKVDIKDVTGGSATDGDEGEHITERKVSVEVLLDEKAKELEELAKRDLEPSVNVESERVMTMEQFNERKSFFEKYIQELQDRLSHEEDSAASLNQSKRKLEGDVQNLKKDLENLELALQKVIFFIFLSLVLMNEILIGRTR